jgi:peptidoglycan/LPS O-acetylase OafA/YrhL
MGREGTARLGALDGLRGLAALGIVVLHVWMFDHGDAHGGFDPRSAQDMAINSCASAWCCSSCSRASCSIARSSPPRAASARSPRCAPTPGGGPRGSCPRTGSRSPARSRCSPGSSIRCGATTGELPVFLLFGQNYLAETAKHLDPPMWSLAVEVSFYAALPLVGFLALRAGPRRSAQLALCGGLALAGLAYTALSVARAWPWTATATLPIHLTEFAAGMAVAVLLHRRGLSRRTGLALLGAGAALVAGDALWHELGPSRR